MTIFHAGTRDEIAETRRTGFVDGCRFVQLGSAGWTESGVWFSDSPAPDRHQSIPFSQADYVALAVPEDRLERYEVPDPTMNDRRRWYIPAAVANQWLTRIENN